MRLDNDRIRPGRMPLTPGTLLAPHSLPEGQALCITADFLRCTPPTAPWLIHAAKLSAVLLDEEPPGAKDEALRTSAVRPDAFGAFAASTGDKRKQQANNLLFRL